MKRLLPAVLCATTLSLGLSPVFAQEDEAPANATPQPDAVTQDWSFDFEYTQPDTIAIENPDGSIDWYWYMTYKVTNFDYDELFFDPRIVIHSNNGEIVTANLGVDATVFKEVRNLLENPLLQAPVEVPGRVFKGENYARQSAIIWKVSDEDIDHFKVFIGGIYGETKTVTDPNTGEPIMVPVIDALSGKEVKDADGKTLMQPLQVKRTRMIHYETPGTTESQQDPAIKLVEEKDVLR
ncbi:MAG: hypothetical protein ACPG4Q_00625 [Phycisphaeraceae bacterium]|jgi:hypothetical protein